MNDKSLQLLISWEKSFECNDAIGLHEIEIMAHLNNETHGVRTRVRPLPDQQRNNYYANNQNKHFSSLIWVPNECWILSIVGWFDANIEIGLLSERCLSIALDGIDCQHSPQRLHRQTELEQQSSGLWSQVIPRLRHRRESRERLTIKLCMW